MKERYILFRGLLRILFRGLFKLTVAGSASVPPAGGVLVAANHRSYLDPLVLCAALPRQATFVAMKELFDVPLMGPILRPYCIPVDRRRPLPSTIRQTLSALNRGELVVIFPEGGIRVEGERNDLKRGTLLIARLSNSPVIPARINGTDRALPPASRLPRLSRVSVSFSAALDVCALASDDDMTLTITAVLMGDNR